MLIAVVGMLVLGGIGVGAFSSGGSNRSTATTKPAAPSGAGLPGAPVDPADVAAASACESFVKFLDAATTGSVTQSVFQPFVNNANALVAGAKPGQPAPKWFQLGSELVSVGDDVVKDNPQQLQSDATAASQQCSAIPLAADRAAGYTPPGK